MADSKISGLTAGTPIAGDNYVIERGGTANFKVNHSVMSDVLGTSNGWIPVSVTWTYASATTFTIAGDYSAILTKCMKWKATNTTAKSGYILSAVYSSPNTTVTICGDALVSAAITNNYYSTVANPAGFTHVFSYTPSTNLTLGSGTLTGLFSIVNGICNASVYFKMAANTTVASATYFTVPVVPKSTPTAIFTGVAYVLDSGTAEFIILARVETNANQMLFNGNNSAGGITSTYPMTWATNDILGATISYSI